jgi:hypothetical protein
MKKHAALGIVCLARKTYDWEAVAELYGKIIRKIQYKGGKIRLNSVHGLNPGVSNLYLNVVRTLSARIRAFAVLLLRTTEKS